MPALAVTNHGNVGGILDHYVACEKYDIKPILGIELYQARKTRFDKDPEELAGPARNEWDQRGPYHLTVLAQNDVGYRNLIKLSSRAHLEGFYGKPRGDHELLAEHSEGLIVGSGCLNGELQQALLRGEYEVALGIAGAMQEIFGRSNYFVEAQNHGIEEQLRIFPELLQIAKTINAPVVATGDCHYVYEHEHDHHDTMLCIGGGLKSDENRFRFEKNEFYLKSYEQMLERHEPEWLKASLDIAEMVDLKLDFSEFHFPVFPDTPDDQTAFQYMEELTWSGLRERYGEELSPEVEARAKYELGVVERMNFPDYFLVVADLVNWAKNNDIRVGFGRGSAAGSIISYALGITGLEPLKFGLMFERFLNPDRVSMPDIDIDFDSRYRDRVIQYARDKYGDNRVAHIATYQSILARRAITDAARALGYEYSVGTRISGLVPTPVLGVSKKLSECLRDVADFRKAYDSDPDAKKIIDAAMGIEGILRQPGMHAAGVVITKTDLTDYVPLMMSRGKNPVVMTQVDYRWVERLGLLKIDFLALANLDVIDDTEKIIRAHIDSEFEAYKVDLDDAETYKLLSDGHGIGTFQLEGGGMREVTSALQPDTIYDIMALISLYRPGPLGANMHTTYINRKHGREKVEYPHPSLEEHLRDSRGILLYQEDVLNVITVLAGWNAGDADDMRRVMGKKKMDQVAAYKPKFVDGCLETAGVSEVLASKIFGDIEHFAGYGFNRAHAASYAMISYITAYLKTHYPAEYMCALLSSFADNPDKLSAYLRETKRLGIEILPPSINVSERDFSVGDDSIRFGMGAVRGLGEAIINSILGSRPEGGFSTLYDFFRRSHPDVLNRGTFEKMVLSGMFDELVEEEETVSQDDKADLLSLERVALGAYLTEHPLEDVEYLLASQVDRNIADLAELGDGERITIGGIITEVERKTTKRGDAMYILGFEDLTGSLEVLVFPRDTKRYDGQFAVGDIALFEGRLSVEINEETEVANCRLFFSDMRQPDLPRGLRGRPIVLKFGEQPTYHVLQTLEELIEGHPGNSPVYFEFPHGPHAITMKFTKAVDPEIESALHKVGDLNACL